MAYKFINVSGGFTINDEAGAPIDSRLVLTKEEMLTAEDDFYMPEVYLAVCSDDGQLYVFDANNDADPETGKFKKFTGDATAPNAEVGDTAPADPKAGDKWLDTSTTPPTEKEWNGTQWVATTPIAGEMMYDSTNGAILYFDGTEWKPVGGGIEKETSVDTSKPGTPGDIVYDETTKQYMIYEPAVSPDTSGVWVNMAKVWEGTEAQYTALGGDAWSQRHPDIICFVK